LSKSFSIIIEVLLNRLKFTIFYNKNKIMKLKSINPYTNQIIHEYDEFADSELTDAIEKSNKAFGLWRNTGFKDRSRLLSKTAEVLSLQKDNFARTITMEMGKTIKESRAEIEKCVWVCNYYAESAEAMLSSETIKTDAKLSRIEYAPLGVILGIMPWNFPFWQVFRFAIPAIAAGNSILLKHASNVQGCASHIESIFKTAGFPENIFQNLPINSSKVGNIIEHKAIKAVSLTGSVSAGSAIASEAGRSIKKTVLELGGNNAFVVFDDADIEKAVEIGIAARMQNAGQSCIAAKRFLVHTKIAEAFVSQYKEKIRHLRVGDPMDENIDMGPLSSIAQAAQVEDQVDASVHLGAKSEFLTRRRQAFYYPTVVTQVKPGMPVFDEEVFGPVATVTEFKTDEEAVDLINNSTFGLGVSLFTRDIQRAERLIPQISDGSVFINSMVKSDPRLPFGGTKNSGYGRELSYYGIREFTNVKTVYIAEG
jgi:succinate-semialdehyde dehydrogenase/glutarate-semialdehyde dehydrogenase